MISYDGKRFRADGNAATGDVGTETIFEYRQTGAIVWATYRGGSIAMGTLIATVATDGSLDMRYQHVDNEGQLKTGTFRSIPEHLPDGRLRLRETWHWTSGASGAGTSTVTEVIATQEPNSAD